MMYWIVKTEPNAYSWMDLENEGEVVWDGVRNFQARNFLKQMRVGDQVYFYHSGAEKALVGLAEVRKEAFPDAQDEAWVAVVLAPSYRLSSPITLRQIQDNPRLREISLVKQSRLSVHSLDKEAFLLISKLAV